MRTSLLVVFTLLPTTVLAGGHGGGGGGGRLGQVSGGISTASHPPAPPPSSGPPPTSGTTTTTINDDPDYRDTDYYDENGRPRAIYTLEGSDAVVVRRLVPVDRTPRDPATVDVFVGVSDTYESNTAASASIAVTDSMLRLVGDATRYWEDLPDGGRLTMTLASIALGLRLPVPAGAAFLQAGMTYAKTASDPVMDSSITGATFGLHVEGAAPFATRLVGDARVILFQHDIHAYEARLAVRTHHLEAGFRILDFDVGPALFGPEVGLAF